MQDRLRATYRLESGYPLERVAQVIAGEQSSGTFVAVPGETAELRERAGARVERITEFADADAPSLPGAGHDGSGRWRRGEIELSWPLDNLGPSLPNLVATVAGNLFELREVSGLRLLDVQLPKAFAEKNPGPQFGIAGTRALAGVPDRPLIGTIIKPSVGLSPEDTAALVRVLCDGGIDFIKDDELQADGAPLPAAVGGGYAAPVELTTEAAIEVLLRAAQSNPGVELLPWLEREFTLHAMKATRGNQVRAAKLLGIA